VPRMWTNSLRWPV